MSSLNYFNSERIYVNGTGADRYMRKEEPERERERARSNYVSKHSYDRANSKQLKRQATKAQRQWRPLVKRRSSGS